VAVAVAVVGVASACGSFGAGDPPPSSTPPDPDAHANGDTIEDGGDSGPSPRKDAAAEGGLPRIPSACPRPAPPTSCLPGVTCASRTLYVPPPAAATEYPFRLVTDEGFVYWATQVAGASPADDPYNGRGIGRIVRVDRRGVNAGGQATVLAADQRSAVALTLAGAYVYWGAETSAGTAQVLRALRACPGSCAIEPVVDLPGARIVAMGAADDATLFILNEAGQLIRVVVAPTGVGAATTTATTGSLPGFVMTSTDGYVSALTKPEIRRLSANGSSAALVTTLSPSDEGLSTGIAPIATDCTNLWGHRGGGSVWRGPLDGGPYEARANLGLTSIYDLTTDAQYLYAAAPNAGGVFAMHMATGEVTPVIAGNVFSLTNDDQGVYWGEHGPSGTGGIHMMVK
jgi:hypothetical protein